MRKGEPKVIRPPDASILTFKQVKQLIKGHGKSRVIFSPCMRCMTPLHDGVGLLGMFKDKDTLTRTVFYMLCKDCAKEFHTADDKRLTELSELIEYNLETLGVFVGIEKQGLDA